MLASFSDYEMTLRVWNISTPALDLQLSNTSVDPTSEHGYASVYDGWTIREDGWAVNSSQQLLFWVPPGLASVWCSPYATLVVTQSGTLQVPKQKLFIGDQWTECYVPD
ncbi:vegetative incompatibility protein HET-E-1, partial [Rhizoctonia solani AG-3 Rhs1AP]